MTLFFFVRKTCVKNRQLCDRFVLRPSFPNQTFEYTYIRKTVLCSVDQSKHDSFSLHADVLIVELSYHRLIRLNPLGCIRISFEKPDRKSVV